RRHTRWPRDWSSDVYSSDLGAALRTGLTSARYDFVFFTDSDNQFDVSELEYFLPLMDEYEMVTGFRVYRYDTVLRCMLSWIYNQIGRASCRERVYIPARGVT